MRRQDEKRLDWRKGLVCENSPLLSLLDAFCNYSGFLSPFLYMEQSWCPEGARVLTEAVNLLNKGAYPECLPLFAQAFQLYRQTILPTTRPDVQARLWQRLQPFQQAAEQVREKLYAASRPTPTPPAADEKSQSSAATTTSATSNGVGDPDGEGLLARVQDMIVDHKKLAKLTWDDISGVEEAKRMFRTQLRVSASSSTALHPVMSKHYQTEAFRAALLYGPGGTGKTLLVRILAAQHPEAILMEIRCSRVLNRYQGTSEKVMDSIFDYIDSIKPTPVILFIDEMDAMFRSRNSEHMTQSLENVITAFMTRTAGLELENNNMTVIGASNYPWKIDPPVVRRLAQKMFIGLPSREEKQTYMTTKCQHYPFLLSRMTEIDWCSWLDAMPLLTFADLNEMWSKQQWWVADLPQKATHFIVLESTATASSHKIKLAPLVAEEQTCFFVAEYDLTEWTDAGRPHQIESTEGKEAVHSHVVLRTTLRDLLCHNLELSIDLPLLAPTIILGWLKTTIPTSNQKTLDQYKEWVGVNVG